jgi:DsbC/DsbD-like thiol-disulfide interchange protein
MRLAVRSAGDASRPPARYIPAMRRPALALTLVLVALAAPVAAAPRSEASLIAGWAEPGGGRVAGLTLALAPGWKTYWRAPGEAGIPPTLDFSASQNLAEVAVEWPAPRRFDSFGLATLGYEGEVTLPLRLTAIDPAAPVALRLTLDYGVCADICVPERAELALDIAPDAPPEGGAAIAAARARAPRAGAEAGLVRADCGVEGAGPERRFSARLAFEPPLTEAPFVVVEGPPGAWFGAARTAVEGDALLAEAEVVAAPDSLWIARDALVVTLVDAAGAVELRGCAGPPG